mmetsp:Transcript_96034/g.299055  ORF Transcript_96034/g.299055 Transcript_96034/m.299055 type:complete len:242 (+) Transcript_96034:352-1077(+)
MDDGGRVGGDAKGQAHVRNGLATLGLSDRHRDDDGLPDGAGRPGEELGADLAPPRDDASGQHPEAQVHHALAQQRRRRQDEMQGPELDLALHPEPEQETGAQDVLQRGGQRGSVAKTPGSMRLGPGAQAASGLPAGLRAGCRLGCALRVRGEARLAALLAQAEFHPRPGPQEESSSGQRGYGRRVHMDRELEAYPRVQAPRQVQTAALLFATVARTFRPDASAAAIARHREHHRESLPSAE